MGYDDPPSETASAEAAPADVPRRRSRWSIGLGSVLLFAAGMMVGFAPMRAWLFFRDEPEMISFRVILFDVAVDRGEALRKALAEAESRSGPSPFNPMTVLRNEPSVDVLSRPHITMLVDQTATVQVGSVVPPATGLAAGSVQQGVVGTSMSFTPRLRTSGAVELEYRFEDTEYRDRQSQNPADLRSVTVESSFVAEQGVWRLIEFDQPTTDAIRTGKTRWVLLQLFQLPPP